MGLKRFNVNILTAIFCFLGSCGQRKWCKTHPQSPASEPFRCCLDATRCFVCAGGGGVAEEFRSQEIDGQALLLLTEDHLVGAMNLKLGPALKLHAHINSLKDA